MYASSSPCTANRLDMSSCQWRHKRCRSLSDQRHCDCRARARYIHQTLNSLLLNKELKCVDLATKLIFHADLRQRCVELPQNADCKCATLLMKNKTHAGCRSPENARKRTWLHWEATSTNAHYQRKLTCNNM